MQKANLYIKDWLSIHPYTRQQPSDNYFVQLANRLFHICPLNEIPEAFKKKICLYTAATWKMSFRDWDFGSLSSTNIRNFTEPHSPSIR